MSRIGKAPVVLPAGVTAKVENNVVTVKGPKGELRQEFHSDLTVKVEENHIVVTVRATTSSTVHTTVLYAR